MHVEVCEGDARRGPKWGPENGAKKIPHPLHTHRSVQSLATLRTQKGPKSGADLVQFWPETGPEPGPKTGPKNGPHFGASYCALIRGARNRAQKAGPKLDPRFGTKNSAKLAKKRNPQHQLPACAVGVQSVRLFSGSFFGPDFGTGQQTS